MIYLDILKRHISTVILKRYVSEVLVKEIKNPFSKLQIFDCLKQDLKRKIKYSILRTRQKFLLQVII
jgi:hypothetical protein